MEKLYNEKKAYFIFHFILLALYCFLYIQTKRPAINETKGPTEVFLLLGQSNMLGVGKIETLDNHLLNLPANVDFYFKDQKMTFKEKTVRPHTFGPEITFSKLISTHFSRGTNIVIVKFGVGGRSIRCWDQNWRNSEATCEKGDRYNELMSYIKQFMNNQKFKFSGIF